MKEIIEKPFDKRIVGKGKTIWQRTTSD